MTSRNTIPTAEEDYLEVDDRIPGQNYVCISFVSPEDVLQQKEFFTYFTDLWRSSASRNSSHLKVQQIYAGINTKFEATN